MIPPHHMPISVIPRPWRLRLVKIAESRLAGRLPVQTATLGHHAIMRNPGNNARSILPSINSHEEDKETHPPRTIIFNHEPHEQAWRKHTTGHGLHGQDTTLQTGTDYGRDTDLHDGHGQQTDRSVGENRQITNSCNPITKAATIENFRAIVLVRG